MSGVIADQKVTTFSGAQGLASPNPFTISDLTNRWILCDVYESDLAQVHLGEYAGLRLNGYPAVPASAVLRLHDRDRVYEPAGKTGSREWVSPAAACCPTSVRRSCPASCLAIWSSSTLWFYKAWSRSNA